MQKNGGVRQNKQSIIRLLTFINFMNMWTHYLSNRKYTNRFWYEDISSKDFLNSNNK